MQDDYGGRNEILHTLSDISETLKKSEEDDIRSMEGWWKPPNVMAPAMPELVSLE